MDIEELLLELRKLGFVDLSSMNGFNWVAVLKLKDIAHCAIDVTPQKALQELYDKVRVRHESDEAEKLEMLWKLTK